MPADERPGQVTLRLSAPAKINLFLRVTGRRDDGYHTLLSRMQKLSLGDELQLERRAQGISLSCPGGTAPDDARNLAWRAAELFFATLREKGEKPPFGVHIHVQKRIPTAAGLGGGSSDAAAVLRGLQYLSGARLSEAVLMDLALQLGADVPFFVRPEPAALASGIGEELAPAEPLEDCTVLLVNPGFAVSTRWVYQNLDLTRASLKDSFHCSCNVLKKTLPCDLVNDLEQTTVARYPLVAELKAELVRRGAYGALMAGSGPTVFGLFAERAAAERCKIHFEREERGFFCFLARPLQK